MSADFTELPPDLPVPEDDGAADHLPGLTVPSLALPASTGVEIDLAELARELAVIYVYPRTGRPGLPLPHGWDDIPGARGCTPQSCAYRDALAGFQDRGAALAGLSAQTPEGQREFAFREQIAFPLLSEPRAAAGRPPRPAHLRGRGHDVLQAADAGRRAGRDRRRLLPGLPARPRRHPGPRLARRAARLSRARLPPRGGSRPTELPMEAPRFELGSADAARGHLQV